jgi:catechol 2,3-dioxygenase-like lactoylglutathione lyase family enzyme
MNRMSHVSALRGVVIETPDLEASTSFYTDVWGLDLVGPRDPERRYFRGRGSEPWVLGLQKGPGHQLLRLRLALPSLVEVDLAYARLCAAGVAPRNRPAWLDGPGSYYGFELVDPDNRVLELSTTTHKASPSARSAPAPIRASHLVLNSPRPRDAVEFYRSMLGFTISDWYEKDAIVFLRCNNDHHCVGIGQGSNAALNHLAFLVDDEAAVLSAGQQAIEKGAVSVWGPGRHGPGGNVFSYFKDPADYVVEYTAELIQIAAGESWLAKEWQRTPANANVWGTGGPTPEAIRLMSGES